METKLVDFDHVALRPPSMDVDVPVILSAPEEQRYIINDAIYKKETQNCQQVLFYNVVISLCESLKWPIAIGLRPPCRASSIKNG